MFGLELRLTRRFVTAACALIMLMAGAASGQETETPAVPEGKQTDAPSKSESQETVELVKEFYRITAASYLTPADAKTKLKSRLKLVDRPIMSWSSIAETGGRWIGDVFVWTNQDGPAVAGCLLSAPEPYGDSRAFYYEFTSLSPKKLAGLSLGGRTTWSPGSREFKPIPGSDEPGTSRGIRLAQMRALAKKLVARMTEDDGDVDTLRLLPQPIYRYPAEMRRDGAPIDGAVFAFVSSVGTDPELLVTIESATHKNKSRWQFMAARFTHRELWLTVGDTEVWRTGVHDIANQTLDQAYTFGGIGRATIEEIREGNKQVKERKAMEEARAASTSQTDSK